MKMSKFKISRIEAYSLFNETDFTVMDDELHTVFNSDQRGEQEQTMQFFLIEKDMVLLEIYWDDEKVCEYTFGGHEGKKTNDDFEVFEFEKRMKEESNNFLIERFSFLNKMGFRSEDEQLQLAVVRQEIINRMRND